MSHTTPRYWLRLRYTKRWTYVSLTVPLGPNTFQTFSARVDNVWIRRELQRRGVLIGFSLGGIWKAVKSVAKKTGIAKVLSVAQKALPIAARLLPPPANLAAAGAVTAFGVASDLTRSAHARKHGDNAASTAYLARAMKRGEAYGNIVGPAQAQSALRGGQRLYRILVQPLR